MRQLVLLFKSSSMFICTYWKFRRHCGYIEKPVKWHLHTTNTHGERHVLCKRLHNPKFIPDKGKTPVTFTVTFQVTCHKPCSLIHTPHLPLMWVKTVLQLSTSTPKREVLKELTLLLQCSNISWTDKILIQNLNTKSHHFILLTQLLLVVLLLFNFYPNHFMCDLTPYLLHTIELWIGKELSGPTMSCLEHASVVSECLSILIIFHRSALRQGSIIIPITQKES